jgi:hypothetical protein
MAGRCAGRPLLQFEQRYLHCSEVALQLEDVFAGLAGIAPGHPGPARDNHQRDKQKQTHDCSFYCSLGIICQQ